jgi:hypothetical protein
MTDTIKAAATTRQKTLKQLAQMGAGALIGAGATIALLTSLGSARFAFHDPSRVAALGVGIVFALIGLIVGIGVIAPKAGAQMLNVEDAEEVRDQRRSLGRGALIILLAGLAMLALALTVVDGAKGLFSRDMAGIIVAFCVVAIAGLSIGGRGEQDELMKVAGTEASAMAMVVTLVGLGAWAVLSYLGFVAWIAPLGMLSGLLVVQFVTIFAVSARRGMLRPR